MGQKSSIHEYENREKKKHISQNFNKKHNTHLLGDIIPHTKIDNLFGTDSKCGGVHIRVVVLKSGTCEIIEVPIKT